jgi:very-short-patch-repair endonuclease
MPPPAQSRLTQVFKFLKELNELRNPVARDLSGAGALRLDEWPEHPYVKVRRGDRMELDDDAPGEEMEPIILIRRATLIPCPKPPDLLDGWLKPGWQRVDAEVGVLPALNFLDPKNQTITVAFTDDSSRVHALNSWAAARDKWMVAERPAIAARQLFEEIHALWTMLLREGDRLELVLADGMLGVSEHYVRHPVLMQRVSLVFDPSVPEFRFNTGTEKVELHRALLRLVPSTHGQMIAHFDKELEREPVEPLGSASTDGFLTRLVQGLFNDGEFVQGTVRGTPTDRPSIWREPVIFLRTRTAGLSTTLDYIVEDLENPDTRPSEGLSRIVGVEAENATHHLAGNVEGTARPTPGGPEPDILFSKPANAEQYEIASRLTRAKAVLVQGPPGTGKTHTIANLLGHLLSQGKTVLVTAHTTKALRVLRQQVDEALQPLCLSVLEGDADSQAQLRRAAQDIADRLSRSDAAGLRREAGLLREKRRKLLDFAAALRRKLRDARFSEVEEIVVGGEGLSPIEAAKRVKADAERDGWIPGPLQSGVLCPLTEAEVRQLYATQAILTPGDEADLSVPQPALVEMVAPADFRLLAAEQASADSRARSHQPEFWDESTVAGVAAAQLQELHQKVQASAAMLAEEDKWLREILFAGWTGGGTWDAWGDLLEVIQQLENEAGTAHRLIAAHGPELPQNQPVDQVADVLSQLLAFLEAGGSLGFKTKLTRKAWHQLIGSCRVGNRAPKSLDEFRALHAKAKLEESRSRFLSRWQRMVGELGGPKIEGQHPERTAVNYAAAIRVRLGWRTEVWEPLLGGLCVAGFRWEAWLAAHPPVGGDHGELARVQLAAQGLPTVVEAQAALLRQAELSAALQAQRTYLASFPQSEVAAVLLRAQDSWDVESYEEACCELARLEGLRPAFERRTALLNALESAAPAWTQAISQRAGLHDAAQPPGEVVPAWRWRQWLQELDRRAAVSMTELQDRLARTTDDLRSVAAQIIEHETWAAQCERTGLQEQQALMGFVQTMRKVGKGTGKLVPQMLRQARQLLTTARRAVPVWIMPLNRVYESFDPRDKLPGRDSVFDVVIIDEASQSDVTALAALYLGREHIVVGDDQQVTPDAVGQQIVQVQRLISTELVGIPNDHLYDGQTSIYDLAQAAFGGVVCLREHFRCVPEIIQFSNDLSYNNTIRPLREPLSASIRPALVAHRVHGFRNERGKTNTVEAEEIASLVVACLNDPEYAVNESGRPTSYGVISLLGDEQALLIENLLRQRLRPDDLVKHRLLCGNAAQFQGDERDVVFLSMVDGPPEDGQLARRDAGPKDLFKKRYNVAVSRARNQLWVVHSLDPETHLKSGDLRRRLIEHARDPQALMRAFETNAQRTDSVFEKLVLQRLVNAGYQVKPQWRVGAYRIDLVVEGKSAGGKPCRLAVECDGERWHTHEQLQSDLERQAILERLGWVFVRIRGNVFFRDPDAAMAPVFSKLNQLDIEPLGSAAPIESATESLTIERIRQAAEKVRASWAQRTFDLES